MGFGHHHHEHCGHPHRGRFFDFAGRRGGRGEGGPGFGGGFGRGPFGGRGGDGFRIGRMVADGDLRLIVLSLLEKTPRHGYDVIKAIEELTSGSYSPSPGVIYPTLTFLEEAGQATATTEGNKKVYAITDAGKAHLNENRVGVEAVLDHLARIGKRIAQARAWFGRDEDGPRGERPDRDIPDVIPAMNEARRALKGAIASRIGDDEAEQQRVADILQRAAEEIMRGKAGGIDL
ncbi:PadR family transcriptional regulator [Kaistia dalseonensis]|uniref:DNA-binding PadR family transcriptional regulator n=1 Tax=Kaistia dalseonensis TaxID=410840 RepID=A0ABU0HB81_9HYPH|nr:PadR family transcriptional regulator [Kaistia dalseonensis]MCX5496943.1 PadR family transcriptional regulator [Kaistia dalseonensis]MDQ0439569.1 DNA-binding PadR family transcriptional regulator [Kaistia dalseonensis]